MILPIIFLNYLLFFGDLGIIPWAIFFFGCIFGCISFYIHYSKKISLESPEEKQLSTEKLYTFSSFLLFFTITFGYFSAFKAGLISFDFSWNALTVAIAIILVILHDAYFYAIHRFLHLPKAMSSIHKIHHQSHPSNIWSSYSFHPVEALLFAGASLIIFVTEINFFALLFAIGFNDIFTILGHSGYELFTKKIKGSWVYKVFATTTYHDVHHSRNNGNIGLYFTHLDKIFHTSSKDTEKVFDILK